MRITNQVAEEYGSKGSTHITKDYHVCVCVRVSVSVKRGLHVVLYASRACTRACSNAPPNATNASHASILVRSRPKYMFKINQSRGSVVLARIAAATYRGMKLNRIQPFGNGFIPQSLGGRNTNALRFSGNTLNRTTLKRTLHYHKTRTTLKQPLHYHKTSGPPEM